ARIALLRHLKVRQAGSSVTNRRRIDPPPTLAAGVFDQPPAMRLIRAKAEFLRELLPDVTRGVDLRTAFDVGCGFGYFSAFLKERGFAVQAIDVRPENITEAKSRYADIG